jgi:hypothetical protein
MDCEGFAGGGRAGIAMPIDLGLPGIREGHLCSSVFICGS